MVHTNICRNNGTLEISTISELSQSQKRTITVYHLWVLYLYKHKNMFTVDIKVQGRGQRGVSVAKRVFAALPDDLNSVPRTHA